MSVLTAMARVFPPPRYLTFPSVGIDVSDASLKFIKFSFVPGRDQSIRLALWGDIPVPPGAVVNGVIQNPDAVITLLKEVKKQCNVDHVRISLPEERAYIFETTVPKDVPLQDIRGHLEFKLEENVPLSARDAFFDYEIVGESEEENQMSAVVTVYGKETILAYEDVCKKAGLIPLSYEVEAEAIARAVVPRGDEDTFMIMDLGKTRTGIGIVHKGALMYTSTIDIGGDELSAVMKTQLGELDEAALTELKNKHGLVGGYVSDLVRQELLKVIDRIIAEIQVRIEYWNARELARGERKVGNLIISGGAVNLAGLPEYLEEKLQISVTRASVWQNIPVFTRKVPPITKRYAYGYATAVGLALADVTECSI